MRLFAESPILGSVLLFSAILTSNIILFLLFIALCCFYREPSTLAEYNDKYIYSPSYGKVSAITKIGNRLRITILLSLFDPHIQYYPTNGTYVETIVNDTNQFKNIFIYNSDHNSNVHHVLKTDDGKIIDVVQYAGFAARQIAYDIKKEFKTGNYLGMIKLSSRVDLEIEIPKEIYINIGDYVEGGITKIALK